MSSTTTVEVNNAAALCEVMVADVVGRRGGVSGNGRQDG